MSVGVYRLYFDIETCNPQRPFFAGKVITIAYKGSGADRPRRYLLPYLESSPEVPPVLREKVERGELGVKTGKGFCEWTPESAEELRQRIALAFAHAQSMERTPQSLTGTILGPQARANRTRGPAIFFVRRGKVRLTGVGR